MYIHYYKLIKFTHHKWGGGVFSLIYLLTNLAYIVPVEPLYYGHPRDNVKCPD